LLLAKYTYIPLLFTDECSSLLASMSAQHIVFKAVFIIAMLAGHDCARIMSQASLETARQRIGSHFSSKSAGSAGHTESAAWWIRGGNEVCREKDLGIERYQHKMQKLRSLSSNLREKTCGKSCPQKWLELKERMLHFDSCAQLLQDDATSNISPALKEAMMKGDDALLSGILEPMGAVSALLKKKNFFPTFDDLPECSFNPTVLNVDSAMKISNPEDAVREQLFGQDCDEASSKRYIGRLQGAAHRIATNTLDQLSHVLALKLRVDDVGKAAESNDKDLMQRADVELKKEVEAVSTKLTEQLNEGKDQEVKLFGEEAVTQVAMDEEADDLSTNGTMSVLLEVDPDHPDAKPRSSKLSRFVSKMDNAFFQVIAWFLGILLAIMITAFLVSFLQAGGLGIVLDGTARIIVHAGSAVHMVFEVPLNAAVRLGATAGRGMAAALAR